MNILTEEELKEIKKQIVLGYMDEDINTELSDLFYSVIKSHSSLLSANAELSFQKNSYKKALSKIVCLNIPMPDEVFNLANNVLEELK